MKRPAAFAIHTSDKLPAADMAHGWLTLRATEDGWSLVASNGEVVFHSPGVGGRRKCLEFARAHGVISVLS